MLWVTMKTARVGILWSLPELQQFAAEVLGGEHVQRGERLVHEQHFRLDHQRAGEAHALLHAAGEFLGIGAFEAVETHGVQHLQAALASRSAAARRAPSAAPATFSSTVSHGKQRETLKDDGNILTGPPTS